MRSNIALFALPLVYAVTHEVSVGEGGLVFKPDTVTASVGDVVKFNFYPQRHSVAQSTFDAPCQPRDAGIFSGYVSVSSGSAPDSFTVPINNTDAIWLYCSAASHCQSGMVMVINPVGGMSATSLDNYKTAAGRATQNNGPSGDAVAGGVWTQNSSASSSSSSAAASSSSSSAATASSGSSASATGSSASGTSTGSSSASATSSKVSPSSSGSSNSATGLKAGGAGAVVGGLVLGAWALI